MIFERGSQYLIKKKNDRQKSYLCSTCHDVSWLYKESFYIDYSIKSLTTVWSWK